MIKIKKVLQGESKMDIIATVSPSIKGDFLEKLVEQSINIGEKHFRFNFGKYNAKEGIEQRINEISRLKKKYEIQIMIDIPYPFRKPRLYINNGQKYISVVAGDTFVIGCEKNNYLYTDAIEINHICLGDVITDSEGERIFSVKEKLKNGLLVEATKDCCITNRRGICLGPLIDNYNNLDLYKDIIRSLKPNSVALSFVSNNRDVKYFKQKLDYDCEIISKIESQDGLNNVDEISKDSNLMVARGDLMLYTDYRLIAKSQSRIVEASRNANRRLYIATGILSSLYKNDIPTQAELIDVFNIVNAKPNGIVLNNAVVQNNYAQAVNIIRYIEKNSFSQMFGR